MMQIRLTYPTSASRETERNGITVPGIDPVVDFSPCPNFETEARFWTPGHFLLAAVASSFVVTLSTFAKEARLDFGKFELTVEGKLHECDGRRSVREIILKPTLTILKSQDQDRAYSLLERAELKSWVAHTLKCPVFMEPLVQTAEELLTR
jgi:uncharacterized OsmC-like protein